MSTSLDPDPVGHFVAQDLGTNCLQRLIYKMESSRLERSGSVIECLTRDGGAAGLSLTGVTALWSLSKTHLSILSTGSTQEDTSLFNCKIVDWT